MWIQPLRHAYARRNETEEGIFSKVHSRTTISKQKSTTLKLQAAYVGSPPTTTFVRSTSEQSTRTVASRNQGKDRRVCAPNLRRHLHQLPKTSSQTVVVRYTRAEPQTCTGAASVLETAKNHQGNIRTRDIHRIQSIRSFRLELRLLLQVKSARVTEMENRNVLS